jgi:aminoglycoside/choline kinase family phosphotransferase
MSKSQTQIEKNINNLFKDYLGSFPDSMVKLPNSGSNRIYYRLQKNNISVIASYNRDDRENRAFINFTEQFEKAKINVPKILAQDLNKSIYILSDLGDATLLEWLINEKTFSTKAISTYKNVLSELARMQIVAGKDFNYIYCHPFKEFDETAILYDLNYFEENYLSKTGIKYNHISLRTEFALFAKHLLIEKNNYFMFRDFQARNIMLVNDEPFFIDYQGGRKGALQYDLVSLLYQAKAQIPEKIKEELLEYYISVAKNYTKINLTTFTKYYYSFALIRVLQTLGAYGLRGIIEQKAHFLESIPFAINNLKELFPKVVILGELSELKSIISKIINTKFQN